MKDVRQILKIDFYKLIVAIALISVGSGFASYFLHLSVHKISLLLDYSKSFTWTHFAFSLALAMASYTLSRYLFADTQGSGIPQVKLSLVALKGKMAKRMPFGKMLTTILSLSSGLSLGKEGPMVTIAASWAHLVAHVLKVDHKMTKILVASGASAGLSAAFNTPIAAVVFTIEEILGELNTKYLGPIIVTSVIASVTSYELLGNKSTFHQVHYALGVKWHLFLFLALGLVMSLMGFVWVKSILFFKEFKKKYLRNQGYFSVLFAVCLLAVFSQFRTDLAGDGGMGINAFLTGDHLLLVKPLLILFLFKFILSATAYSSGISGGLFMPVLFLGACGGSLFGVALHAMGFDGIQIGAYALLGMTSLLVSVIRAPFTAFVLLFEMTRDYELILPLMVSSIAAYWFSDFLSPESVYEAVSEYEGVHLPTHHENEILDEMVVEQCMIKNITTLNADQMIEEAYAQIKEESFGGYPIIFRNQLVGMISKSEIRRAIEDDIDRNLQDVMKKDIIKIYPDQSLLVAMDKMKRYKIGRLPVMSRFYDKKIIGILTPEDVVFYLKESKEEKSE